MAGHPFPLVEEFHHLRTQTYVERLLDQRIGHRGGVAIDFHMVINIDPGVFPLGLFVGLGGQGPESGTVERLKQRLAGTREFFEGTGIQGRHAGMEGRSDLRQGAEGGMPEPGEHPAFHDVHSDLHLGLIAGLGRACGDAGKASMRREGRLGAIDLGCIAVGTGHGSLQMVRDHDRGDPTEDRKRPHL
jgi:hypothetical protein